MWNYKCDRCGCALDPGERCDCGEAPADDKEVYTEDTFDYGKAKVGDYVSQGVVDNAVNCLPPACMRSDCTQLGEPYSHREDPNSESGVLFSPPSSASPTPEKIASGSSADTASPARTRSEAKTPFMPNTEPKEDTK